MNKLNKKTALILGCTSVGVICLLGGSLAYLNAKKDVKLEMHTGNVGIDNVEITYPQKAENSSNELNDLNVDKDGNLINLNPGDIVPIEFTVNNNGNKSILERSYVYIIFNNKSSDDKGNVNHASGDNYGKYSNFIDMISVTHADKNHTAIDVTKGTYKDENGNTYKALRFSCPDSNSILDGVGNNAEQEAGSLGTSATHKFNINFGIRANVHTQQQSMQIKVFTKAIQYRNSADQDLEELLNDSSFFTADKN